MGRFTSQAFNASLGRLGEIARVDLYHEATPIERLHNIEKQVGRGRLYVKRDDCFPLAFGGNKVRQLEYYFGDALAQNADTVLITGAVQSNFVRLTAAAACKLGMKCHVQLEARVANENPAYLNSGNVLLDSLLGATVSHFPEGEDEAAADKSVNEIAEDLKRDGARPYVIPLSPDHIPIGALGYVLGAQEILEQLAEDDLRVDEIVVASGSGNTHSGLLFGLRALGSPIKVTGACVRRDRHTQFDRIKNRCLALAQLLDVEPAVDDSDIALEDRFLAPGYGLINDHIVNAIKFAARSEALLVDPVYMARTMACTLMRMQQLGTDKSVLMIHTGGTPALFAYQSELSNLFS